MSLISYEKARVLLDICEKFQGLGETILEGQTRCRLIEILQMDSPKISKAESSKDEPAEDEPAEDELEEEEIEELAIREIHGLRLAWNPSTNHCYELYPNDEVGKWLGIYDSTTGKVDMTMPDPENKENWTTLPIVGDVPDPYKKAFLREILIHGEEVAVTTSMSKMDGTSSVKPAISRIYAVNQPSGALGFLYKNRLYANSNTLFKAVFPGKASGNGWHSVCLKRPWGPKKEPSWVSLYKLEHS